MKKFYCHSCGATGQGAVCEHCTSNDTDEVFTGCPACSHQGWTVCGWGLKQCEACEGIYNDADQPLTRSEARLVVKNQWADKPVPVESLRYYDLTICDALRETIVERWHGWFDPATGLIHQTG